MADKQELEKAEQDIIAAQRRVDQQKQVIETLHKDGHDSALARELLQALEQSLAGMKQHRNIVLEELGLYDVGSGALASCMTTAIHSRAICISRSRIAGSLVRLARRTHSRA